MNKLLISTFLLAALLQSPAVADFKFNGKIIGGQNVSIAEHPYQVSVSYFNEHICGGALVTPTHVLTAAHCVHDARARQLRVRTGSSIADGSLIKKVAEVIVHPSYNFETMDYDVAVLKLQNTLSFKPGTKKILVSSEINLIDGSSAFVTGWGDLSENGISSKVLQGVQVHIVPQLECKTAYRELGLNAVTSGMFCAGYQDGGRDACQGDSGGPLTQNGMLIGLVSWGFGCGLKEYPGVYTKLSFPEIRSFITNVAGV